MRGKIEVMTIRFGKDYLRMLYEEGRCLDKKHRFQPSVIAKYQNRVDILISATRKEDLFPLKALNFEALSGDKQGLFSIRVDLKYRLEFEIEEQDGEFHITICTLHELSNHYK